MKEQLYIKKGRRYKKLGYSDGFTGFPTDGIWLVQQKDGCKSSECIMKLGDLESMQPSVNLIIEYRGKIMKYLIDSDKVYLNGISYNNLVLDMLKKITL